MTEGTEHGPAGPGGFCRGCGTPLRPGLQFCTSCGRPAAPPARAAGAGGADGADGAGGSGGPETMTAGAAAPGAGGAAWPGAGTARPGQGAARSGGGAARPGAGTARPGAGGPAAGVSAETPAAAWPGARGARPAAGAGRAGAGAGAGASRPGAGYERPGAGPGGGPGGGWRPPGRHRSRGRPLAIGLGSLAVAGLAVVVILVTHPFSHPAVADSASSTSRSASPGTSRSPGSSSGSSSVPDSSAPPGSTSPASSASSASLPTPQQSSPGLSPQQAATGLAALLATSAGDRQGISDAYNNVLACRAGVAQDAQTFRTAAASHRQLLSQLAGLPGRSALSSAMLSDLARAWQASTSADEDFARWAQDEAGHCTPDDTSDPNFVAAGGPDNLATHYKTLFVTSWNPLASGYGLATYQQNQI